MNTLTEQFEAETGNKAIYRVAVSDYHTLRYVRWLENKIKEIQKVLKLREEEEEEPVYKVLNIDLGPALIQFNDFLVMNNCLTEFYSNLNEQKRCMFTYLNETDPIKYIICGFAWGNTPEGSEYWNNLNKKWAFEIEGEETEEENAYVDLRDLFDEFLDEYECKEDYYINFYMKHKDLNDFFINTSPRRYIADGFSWHCAPEGEYYWGKLNLLWNLQLENLGIINED